MTLNREQFCSDARALAANRVRFMHQGRDPAIGIDCINAPRYLVEKLGIKLPFEFGRYYEMPDGVKLLATMREHLLEINPEEARKGDLYLFRIKRNPQHVAIRVTDDDPPLLIHPLSAPVNRVVEAPLDDSWAMRIVGVFRIPDFADKNPPAYAGGTDKKGQPPAAMEGAGGTDNKEQPPAYAGGTDQNPPATAGGTDRNRTNNG